MKWLTTWTRMWRKADLPPEDRRGAFSKAGHVKHHTALTDRFFYISRRFAILTVYIPLNNNGMVEGAETVPRPISD
jgi:hypothetical protein